MRNLKDKEIEEQGYNEIFKDIIPLLNEISEAHHNIELNKLAYTDTSCKKEHNLINENLKKIREIIKNENR
jgi:hypothetical protein